ncbi:MAG: hypothetical protein WDW36_004596 [Sanguina aurantia]
MAWSHPESGRLLAVAGQDGEVTFWEAPVHARSAAPTGEGLHYRHLSSLRCSTGRPIRQVLFAPVQLGLIVVAASDDGCVHMFEADTVMSPREWTLQSKLQVGPMGQQPSLCWRPFSTGTAPMLAAACGPSVQIWQHDLAHLKWKLHAELQSSSRQPICCLDWAPAMGRPVELLAAGSGSCADVFVLSRDEGGSSSSGGGGGGVVGELYEALQHQGAVWKVEWDLLGISLAVGTDAQRVYVWRADLAGVWRTTSLLEGDASASFGGEDDMRDEEE